MPIIECRTCAYWQPPSKEGYAIAAKNNNPLFGFCHRHAPIIMQTERGYRSMWPSTTDRQWCGEHADVQRQETPA